MVREGEEAPEFTAESTDGEEVRLSRYRGKWVVLYFYPRAFTSGCTREALRFKELHEEFRRLGAEVLGVSTDPPGACRRFSAKHGLPFRLLSDEDGRVSRLYGVLRGDKRTAERVTFVIDPSGRVRHVIKGLKRAEDHADTALRLLLSQAVS